MYKIIVRLPSDRSYTGQLHIEDPAGNLLIGPFSVCGLADNKLARENNNPDRNPLLSFGDTPLGEYEVKQIIKSGKNTTYPEKEFGPEGIVLLQPKQGDAALADANGRFGFFIQGGALSPQGLLRPTDGSLRLSNSQLKGLVRLLSRIGETNFFCVILNATVKKNGKNAPSEETSHRSLMNKMMLAGRLSISIPSMLILSANPSFNKQALAFNEKGSTINQDAFLVPDKLNVSGGMKLADY